MPGTKQKAEQMYAHFSEVATSYNEVRTTDLEPILYIKDKLKGRKKIRATDIGCGGGRYSLLLYQHLPRLQLTCNDVNPSMVAETARYLKANGVQDFSVVRADIADLQLEESAMDCVLTFNAIHHFDPLAFLHKATKALRTNGYVFIYTRLKSQNARNIWGQFFPGFGQKETRLPDLAQVEGWVGSQNTVALHAIEFFKFKRTASFEQLVRQAKHKHYSTFSLYTADQFKEALEQFKKSIKKHFTDSDHIQWFDENVMITLRKN